MADTNIINKVDIPSGTFNVGVKGENVEGTVDQAKKDDRGQEIDATYIKDLSVAGGVMTVIKGDNTTSEVIVGQGNKDITFNNSGQGSASGSGYNGSEPVTVSYNTVGAAPVSHATPAKTYGSGTSANYGHVKLSDTFKTAQTNVAAADGVGASAKAVQDMYAELANDLVSGGEKITLPGEVKIDASSLEGHKSEYFATSANLEEAKTNLTNTLAPKNHAATNTTYGIGTSSKYGHIKLTDDFSTEMSNDAANNGLGASHKGLYEAYNDLLSKYDQLSSTLADLEGNMEDYKRPLGKDGYHKWTVVIDEAYKDGDPNGMVRYEDNAKMYYAGDPDWDKIIGHYPCVFKNGKEQYKLNRDNYNKKENGEDSVLSGADGDVMIMFPKRGYRLERKGNLVVFSLTDHPNDPDYQYYAFKKGNTVKEKFYFGAYEGWNESGKLRSISNSKTPTVNQKIDTFRTQANAVGEGYGIQNWAQWVYIQCLYVLKYKNLNSQETIGVGRQAGQSLIAIGGSEAYGMDCEIIKHKYASYMTDSAHHVKCFGIEDLWANCWDFTDGFGLSAQGKAMYKLDGQGFSGAKTGYTESDCIMTGWTNSPAKSVQGTTELGFVGRIIGGGTSTYYCDGQWSATNTICLVGGSAWDGASCGVFALAVANAPSHSNADVGARLTYI